MKSAGLRWPIDRHDAHPESDSKEVTTRRPRRIAMRGCYARPNTDTTTLNGRGVDGGSGANPQGALREAEGRPSERPEGFAPLPLARSEHPEGFAALPPTRLP